MQPESTPSPVLRLHLLGDASLRRGDGELADVAAQPKRFGLLAYLAVRRPGVYLRRDELLVVFWPESTESRARASLRQALRFLRGHVGDDVIVNRGDGEVGIQPDRLTADASELRRALEAGDDRAAISLYDGELMPNFSLAGAPDFNAWVDAERRSLRSAAVLAALRVADEFEEKGDLREAIARTDWALGLEPSDERVARRLMSLHARAGERTRAIRVYDALADHLADAFDLEPAAPTRSLLRAIRDGDRPAGAQDRAGPATARSLSPKRIVVLPLRNLTEDPELDAPARMAADWIAQGLATVPELEVIPPLAVGPAPGLADGGPAGAGHGAEAPPAPGVAELAASMGAGTVVDGVCYRNGDSVGFQVRFTDVAARTLRPPPDPVEAPAASLRQAVEALQSEVMTTLVPALTSRAIHVRKAATPPRMDAYRSYLDGLERFLAAEWRPALDHFDEATRIAPEYALPGIVAGIAHWNLAELAEARDAIREAEGRRQTVGDFERTMLDMVAAWLRGDWSAAYEAVRRQIEYAPGTIAPFQLAQEARRLNRPGEAADILARLDPRAGELDGWIFYWLERTTAHHFLGDHGVELELARACRALHPTDPLSAIVEVRALAALRRPDDTIRVAQLELTRPGGREPNPGAVLLEAGRELNAHGEPDAGSSLLADAVDWYRAHGASSRRNRRELARALSLAGEWGEARAIFRDLVESAGTSGRIRPTGLHHGHLQAHLDDGFLAVLAALEGDAEELELRRSRLRDLNGDFLYGAHRYWLAAAAAVLGEVDAAVRELRLAFSEGLPMEMFVHSDPYLAGLRGHAPFDALVQPRG